MNASLVVIAFQMLNPAESIGKRGLMLTRDILLIVGIGLVVMTGLLFWALRYARHRKRRRHHTKPGILENQAQAQVAGGEHHRHHHRRRRTRREHRTRNPTLAETGGLPPARTEPPGGPTPPLPG